MGITDKEKIKFENEDGEVEELSWNDLDNTQKLNLIQNQNATNEDDLDDDEIELVNAIRKSGLSPVEYLRLVEKNSVDRYMQNASQPSYTVDQYSDDELFLADFISRMGDITDEEAQEALASAKANESLFQK
jgi:hypothetical protein